MKHDEVSLPDKQKEINRALGNVVEKQLGLRMADRPVVQISLGGEGAVARIAPQPKVKEPEPEVIRRNSQTTPR